MRARLPENRPAKRRPGSSSSVSSTIRSSFWTICSCTGSRASKERMAIPLNEVCVLCNSILLNQGKLQVDKLPGGRTSADSGIKLPLRGGQAERSRLCAALRGFFRRDREEVLVRSAGLCDGADKGEES